MTATIQEIAPDLQSSAPPPPPSPVRPDGLFVYGTLMPSKTKMFTHLTGIKEFLHVPAILYDYILYKVASYPGIVPDPNHQSDHNPFFAVAGEFIKLSHLSDEEFLQAIRNLDRYEGYPNLYTRRVVTVEDVTGNDRRAITYIYNLPINPHTKKGTLSDVQAKDPNYQVLEWR